MTGPDKINVEKAAPIPIVAVMSTRVASSSGRGSRDERGDPSEKALKTTVVICLVGLVAVYLFAFAPKKAAKAAAASAAAPQGKEAVANFDRQSLSTKSR